MKIRNPVLVYVYGLITLGVYYCYWYVKTKDELNKSVNAKIPSAWTWLIPFYIIYWIWLYSKGVATYTKNQLSPGLCFVFLFVFGGIGQAIIQDSYNKVLIPNNSDAMTNFNPAVDMGQMVANNVAATNTGYNQINNSNQPIENNNVVSMPNPVSDTMALNTEPIINSEVNPVDTSFPITPSLDSSPNVATESSSLGLDISSPNPLSNEITTSQDGLISNLPEGSSLEEPEINNQTPNLN